jgi:hypothetical protein
LNADYSDNDYIQLFALCLIYAMQINTGINKVNYESCVNLKATCMLRAMFRIRMISVKEYRYPVLRIRNVLSGSENFFHSRSYRYRTSYVKKGGVVVANVNILFSCRLPYRYHFRITGKVRILPGSRIQGVKAPDRQHFRYRYSASSYRYLLLLFLYRFIN